MKKILAAIVSTMLLLATVVIIISATALEDNVAPTGSFLASCCVLPCDNAALECLDEQWCEEIFEAAKAARLEAIAYANENHCPVATAESVALRDSELIALAEEYFAKTAFESNTMHVLFVHEHRFHWTNTNRIIRPVGGSGTRDDLVPGAVCHFFGMVPPIGVLQIISIDNYDIYVVRHAGSVPLVSCFIPFGYTDCVLYCE